MTEKDFRKIVTELELTKESKDFINEEANKLNSLLKEGIKHFNVNIIDKAYSNKWGLAYEGEKEISYLLEASLKEEKSFPLSNQALINEVYNVLMYGLGVTKLNQIGYDPLDNVLFVYDGDIRINLVLRFNHELEYQNDYFPASDELKEKFIKKASSEFNLFKNAVTLIKSTVDSLNINLDAYEISLLLYYGLTINFTSHTYEVYLKEFNHAVDDFLKEMRIDQDDETYRFLGISRVLSVKRGYTLIDISKPSFNLTANVGEAFTSDLKKLKKAIQKMLEN